MEQPMAGLFQVLWGKPDGTFQAAEALKGTDDKPLVIPLGTDKNAVVDVICTRPMAVDWDGDGNLDLITGNFAGTFYLFMGEGKGRFKPKGELVTSENGQLKIRALQPAGKRVMPAADFLRGQPIRPGQTFGG